MSCNPVEPILSTRRRMNSRTISVSQCGDRTCRRQYSEVAGKRLQAFSRPVARKNSKGMQRRRVTGSKVLGCAFPTGNVLGKACERACKRAGIEDLRFHDSRHEAACRLAPHMPMATLAKIMCWKSIQMAMRYYNPTDAELVEASRVAAQ